ncbi:RNA polymerase sigma factor SigJ [Phaeobacter gallaeciensis]|uniref:RNA polymerase sigma factor, sigma-70 family n=1 Tax=Phaeobacter gallaeciensis TaxID=60890 RepID=A0AAC9Z6L2_9RHOB|nr:RNA polymerase sigma factor SigJ [Phaeobacter gallaeciensis]AHD08329.1 RNA polymerase sigma factor, sigma-70 family [Phaeobacter gallaeciensis DSM 26640]ATE91595.1 RNA polymerase sigma factor, sigma-70 family [Phaeobacter gallaeciensis]ATE95871.1 RNA polymerase sigma factor, sigma-70 family [Phaeobacter gallaeciensis]ATF00211.1 RNA polymerase sigma factor, sigma-70 family [Phaeobacter gallaeciensis]ATF04643.1 RNA polymerase sigma factor, sigma-70 family [Phaeobacter gallaeciensis]
MTAQTKDTGTDAFLTARPRLFAAAYRMLGSVTDAEDILQDAYLRWQSAPKGEVLDATGYLMRITTRLCLDQLKSARVRRETYPGEWLPEPVLTDETTELLDHDVSVALLLALDALSPLERAAFLLHDIFDSSYNDVASALNRTPEACRQLATRARRKVQARRPDAPSNPDQGAALTEAFFRASKTGDTAALTQLLTKDVQLISDGGGKAMAALNPIYGRDKVLRLLAGLARKSDQTVPEKWRACQLNGLPAVLSRGEDGILQATSLDIRDGRIACIYVTRNPDKTGHLASVLG